MLVKEVLVFCAYESLSANPRRMKIVFNSVVRFNNCRINVDNSGRWSITYQNPGKRNIREVVKRERTVPAPRGGGINFLIT